MRVSSTRLGTFESCPSKWFKEDMQGKGIPNSFAMATGTVYHSIQEWVVERKFWPKKSDILALPGNYAPPGDSIRAFPECWDLAMTMARHVGNPRKHPELDWLDWDACKLEQDVEEWGESFCDGEVTAGGYIDALFPEQRVIFDWKTRGSFRYAPDAVALATNMQLLYYAALSARRFGWEDCTVVHANVLRKSKPRLSVIKAQVTRSMLDLTFEYIAEDLVPRMLAASKMDPMDVYRDQTSCFEYGPCTHLSYCDSDAGGSVFALLGGGDDEQSIFSLL